jgi:hypothetical protein
MAREDEKMGNPLWIAELFPAVIFAPLTICISSYLRIASDHQNEKRPWSLIVLTAMCLAVPAWIYDILNKSVWERSLVSATAGLTLGMLAITHLALRFPPAKPNAATDRNPPDIDP